jgi:hypothetical protein
LPWKALNFRAVPENVLFEFNYITSGKDCLWTVGMLYVGFAPLIRKLAQNGRAVYVHSLITAFLLNTGGSFPGFTLLNTL